MMIQNDMLTLLRSFGEQLEPEIAKHMWRSKYVTQLNPQGNTSVEVKEDYSSAEIEIFQRRLQEFAISGTKFELSNKVFKYCLSIDATRSKTEDVVRDVFGAIEWPSGCLLQHQEKPVFINGDTHTLLLWDKKGPDAVWMASPQVTSQKGQQKPFDDVGFSVRCKQLVENHAWRLRTDPYPKTIDLILPELEALKKEFADNPEHLERVGLHLFGAWLKYTPGIVSQPAILAEKYRPEGLSVYLGMISSLFPFKKD